MMPSARNISFLYDLASKQITLDYLLMSGEGNTITWSHKISLADPLLTGETVYYETHELPFDYGSQDFTYHQG